MTARVGLFAASLIGVTYALLSLIDGANSDATAGMIAAAAGIAGWGILDWIEEQR